MAVANYSLGIEPYRELSRIAGIVGAFLNIA